eukprot:COSAG01_NODE_27410_length_686_cov_1.989779_2_plen_76_part_00
MGELYYSNLPLANTADSAGTSRQQLITYYSLTSPTAADREKCLGLRAYSRDFGARQAGPSSGELASTTAAYFTNT